MFTYRLRHSILGAALLGAGLFTSSVSGQEITGFDVSEGTLGTVFTLTGTDLGPKPKLVLVQGGDLVKKTKLKVLGKSDGSTAEVELKAAPAGEYNIAIKKGKTLLDISADVFTVQPPEILDVTPGVAQPGDTVTATVAYNGMNKPRVEVGTKRAKVTSAEPVLTEGGVPTWEVTFVVPKVGDGVWPVFLQNRVGIDILKAALDVNGSPVDISKPGALFAIENGKPVKANQNKITVSQDNDNFDVVAFTGSKKSPRIVAITLPGQVADIEAGMSFSMAPGNVAFTETKKGTESAYLGDAAGKTLGAWAVDVVAVTDDLMTLSMCGSLTNVNGPGPDVLFVSGVITAPRSDNTIDPPGGCEPFATADFGTLPDFVGTPQFGNVFATYNDIGGLVGATSLAMANSAGPVNFGFSTNFDFNPNTQNSGVITGLSLMGTGLRSFVYTEASGTSWVSMLNPDLSTTMTITITDNIPEPNPNLGARGYLVGTFTGTLNNAAMMMSETVSGSFCTRWNNFSDFTDF